MAIEEDAEQFLDECMTIDEVGTASRLSKRQVYKLIHENKLTARKIKRSTRVLRSDYRAFLRALPAWDTNRAA